MTEKQIETQMINWLRLKGVWVQKVHSGVVFQSYMNKYGQHKKFKIQLADKGTPDLLCCIKGQFIGIEVKKTQKEINHLENGNDETAVAQRYQHEKIVNSEGVVITACSLDMLESDLNDLNLL